jgi:CBS domain containing-hemolysin-like protein
VEGDQLQIGEWSLTVEEVRGRRVGRIHAVRHKASEEEDTGA